jgi:hypothetical protein
MRLLSLDPQCQESANPVADRHGGKIQANFRPIQFTPSARPEYREIAGLCYFLASTELGTPASGT